MTPIFPETLPKAEKRPCYFSKIPYRGKEKVPGRSESGLLLRMATPRRPLTPQLEDRQGKESCSQVPQDASAARFGILLDKCIIFDASILSGLKMKRMP